LYQQFDIFFFTVQKFANFIEAKHADLTKFDLIIIDGKINTRGKKRIPMDPKVRWDPTGSTSLPPPWINKYPKKKTEIHFYSI